MFGYIYKTTNLLNNKIYVGQHRVNNDQIDENYYGSGKILDQAIKKYGIQNFNIEILEWCETKEILNEREKFYIEKLNSRDSSIGYNICKGGDCGPGGPMFQNHTHSEETKRKMSINRTGKNNANYGNRWNQSDELKKLHSELSSGKNNGMYGKKHSKESKNKNRQSHIGKIAISNIELDIVKMIYIDELEKYLSDGWIKGNIHAKNFKMIKEQRLSKW